MSAEAPPGVLFHVYLGPAPHGGFKHDDPRYVGTLSFYDAVRSPDGVRGQSNASFDLAGPLRRMHAVGLRPRPILTIVPSGAPADGARAVVSSISVVER